MRCINSTYDYFPVLFLAFIKSSRLRYHRLCLTADHPQINFVLLYGNLRQEKVVIPLCKFGEVKLIREMHQARMKNTCLIFRRCGLPGIQVFRWKFVGQSKRSSQKDTGMSKHDANKE